MLHVNTEHTTRIST